MNRHRQVVAGILGLAMAGCAQDRSVLQRQKSTIGAVELTPAMPSIHQAINQNSETLEAQTQLAASQEQASSASSVAAVEPTTANARPIPITQDTLRQAVAGENATSAEVRMAAQVSPTDITAAPAVAAAETMQLAQPNRDAETIAVSNPGMKSNADAPLAADPMSAGPESATRSPLAESPAAPSAPAAAELPPERDPLLGANPDIMPEFKIPEDRPATRVEARPTEPAPTPATPSTTAPEIPATINADPAAPTAKGAEPSAEVSAQPERDPLLGSNPDIMPSFDLPATPPVRQPAATPNPEPTPKPTTVSAPIPPAEAAAPAAEASAPAAPAAAKPEPVPALAPAPAMPAPAATAEPAPPGVSPSESAPPINALEDPIDLPSLSSPDDDKTSAIIMPAPVQLADVSAPGTVLKSSMFYESKADDKPSAPQAKPVDEPTAIRSKLPPRTVFSAGMVMARIGDEVVTHHELTQAMKAYLASANLPPGQKLSEDEVKMLAKRVLNDIIEKRMVLQEAKREIKSQKSMKMFMEMADKEWMDKELPILLKSKHVANIYELKNKLAESGESIEAIRETYRQETLFHAFIGQKLEPKMKVEYPDMIEYYNKHRKDFDLPAELTWREVIFEVTNPTSRAEAKKKADAALARLRRGEDFAKVAMEISEGPNKAKGGLWKIAPGNYNVAPVNNALESLPIGQISQVIEGPTSYHIVRVEGRRAAGPATLAEVQGKIRLAIRMEKVREQSAVYLDNLKKRTMVSTFYDDEVKQASDEVATQPGGSPPR